MSFPLTLISLAASLAGDTLFAGGHTAKHNAIKTELEAVGVKIGIDGSLDPTSIDYLLKNGVTGTGGLVRLTSPTVSSPTFTGIPVAPTAAAANNSTQISTTAYVDAAVAAAVTGLLDLKTATDCSANPDYPAASKGDAYYVSVAGKIGGASGTSVEAGDLYYANADNAGGTEAGVGASWSHLEHNLVGALVVSNALSELTGVASTARTNIGAAALDSPTFTGVPAAATAAPGTNTTQLATTAFVTAAVAAYAPTYSNPLLGTNNESFGSGAGAALAVGGLRNSLFGKLAGTLLSTGDDNAFFGYNCGSAVTTAVNCTAFGANCLVQHQTGSGQSAFGEESMNRMRGSNNCAFGWATLYGSSTASSNTGSDNSVFGYFAGSGSTGTNTTAAQNCLFGSLAGTKMSTFSNAVAVGYHAMWDATTGGEECVAIGANALDAISTTASIKTVAVGFNAAGAMTTGTDCVAIGHSAMAANLTGIRNVYIGSQSGTTATGGGNTAIGFRTMWLVTSGDGNTCVGDQVMSTGSSNTGSRNSYFGSNTAIRSTTGLDNVGIGYNVFDQLTTSGQNVAVGAGACASKITSTANNLVAIGYAAASLLTSAVDSVFIGHTCGAVATTAGEIVAVGKSAMAAATTGGAQSVAIGAFALDAVTTAVSLSVAVGYKALSDQGSATKNTALGHSAGLNITSGGSNTAIGQDCMGTVAAGAQTGANNTAVGSGACSTLTSGARNCVLGTNALNGASSGSDIIAIGFGAMNNVSTGCSQSIGIGTAALDACGSADIKAVAIGYNGLGALTTGINCVAVGHSALATASTSKNNTGLGFQAGFSTSTGGTGNLFLGVNAGYAATTGSNTCFIGDTTQGATDFAINTVVVDSSQAYGAIWTKPQTWSDRTYVATPNSAPTDGNIQAASVSWYLDEAGTSLKVRVKYTDGTTLKTGTVALL